jgi:hypothetical protein
MGAYRVALVLEDGEAADAPVTVRADPASEWFDAFWVVERADE